MCGKGVISLTFNFIPRHPGYLNDCVHLHYLIAAYLHDVVGSKDCHKAVDASHSSYAFPPQYVLAVLTMHPTGSWLSWITDIQCLHPNHGSSTFKGVHLSVRYYGAKQVPDAPNGDGGRGQARWMQPHIHLSYVCLYVCLHIYVHMYRTYQ